VGVLAGDSGLAATTLYELTGGNPFFVTEVLRAGMAEVPPSARDAVLARVARLSGPAREVLEMAALTGSRVEVGLLELVTGGPTVAVDELVASGLLVADGASLRFRHEIVRLAVEQAIIAHRHASLHTRILEALRAAACGDDAGLAFHAEGAGDGASALHYAALAGRRAAKLGSHREAAAQFERALRFSAGAGSATQAGLWNELAFELSLLDRRQDAADACERALSLWRQAGDRLREGDTMNELARAVGSLCRGQEANAAAEEAVSILEPLGPSVELARAYAHLAGRRMVTCQHDAAIELAGRARVIAEPLGLTAVLSDALNSEACSAVSIGGEWAGRLRRALEIALAAGLHDQAGRAYNNLYNIYGEMWRFAEAEPYYVDGVAYCDDHDLRMLATSMRGERAIILERTGRWDEAVALSAEMLERAGPSPLNRLCPLSQLGTIRARRGEPGVWECLDEAMASADGSSEPQEIVPVRVCRAEAYWLEGKPDLARREAELADDAIAGCHEWLRGAVAVWLRQTGSDRPLPGELAEPYRLQARGDWAKAAQAWSGLGCPYSAGMALLGVAAEEPLREALRIFTGMGAAPAARIARQRLRVLGARPIPAGPRTATRADPLGLTSRQREVLDLICARLTNAEIATRLFISVKTVDHHVSAILTKLGTPTRAKAAAVAARLGLTGAPPA
jgi:DNA-binding CsgD family transcriptional regulator/tetratricopeptide (TPR) repeat protein